MAKQANASSTTTPETIQGQATQMIRAIDAAYAGVDRARGIVDCLVEGLLLDGGGVKEDVPYNPEALFVTLSVVNSMLVEAYEQICVIDKLRPERRVAGVEAR